jgi:hypothetical protein
MRKLDWLLITLAVIFVLSLGKARAESITRDEAKEILRLQYTEFCAMVHPIPPDLIAVIDDAFKKEEKLWAAEWLWLHDIQQKIKDRCGDA